MKKFGSVFVLFCMLFAFAACSSDGDDGSGNGGGSDPTADPNLYIIDDNDVSKGFVSCTGISPSGSDLKNFAGYRGTSWVNGMADGNIIYSIKSETDQDVGVLMQYGYWGWSYALRAGQIIVNGVKDEEILYFNFTNNWKRTAHWKDEAKTVPYDIWAKTNEITIHLTEGDNDIRIVPVAKGAPLEKYTEDSGYGAIYPNGEEDEIKAAEAYGSAYTAEGNLANFDYIQFKGTGLSKGENSVSYKTVAVSSDNEKFGTVSVFPHQDMYIVGTTITVTANPKDGYKFDSWCGTSKSKEASFKVAVDEDLKFAAHFIPNDYDVNDGLEGYASITDDNGTSYTITGGAGGEEITISTLDDLDANKSILSGNEPCVVTFTERITTSDNKSIILNIGSNKTIYGKAGANAGLKNIEMRVEGSNVIIRNMVFGEVIAYDGQSYSGSGNDALSLNGASHVWVDHCELKSNIKPVLNDGITMPEEPNNDLNFEKDFYDGLLDIKNGATWITISNCYFHDHHKAVLCGSGDENPDTSPAGISDRDMRVTFAGNYFKNINARMPLFRWGKGHIYNSYFDAGEFSSDASCINVRAESELYIESNTFVGMKSGYAIGFYYDTNASRTGKWVSSNNTGASNKNDTVDRPKYSYTPSRPAEAPSDVGAVLSADKLQ